MEGSGYSLGEIYLCQDQWDGGPGGYGAPAPAANDNNPGASAPPVFAICPPSCQDPTGGASSSQKLLPLQHPPCPGQRVQLLLPGLEEQRHHHSCKVPKGRCRSVSSFTLECNVCLQFETTQDGGGKQGSLSSTEPHAPTRPNSLKPSSRT